MKNIYPILERLALAYQATERAKQYIQTDEEKLHIENAQKDIIEEKNRFILEYHEEKMMECFKKSETQVGLKPKINSLNKGIEIHNKMRIEYPDHCDELQELRLKFSSKIIRYTLDDFTTRAEKQEYLGKNSAALNIYKEALWFMDQSELLPKYKEEFTNEIAEKISHVKRLQAI